MKKTSENPIGLGEIEALAKNYADARAVMAERVGALEEEVRAIQRRKMPGIKLALAASVDAQAKLTEALRANPGLFKSPRSLTIHGIKLGYQKGKGGLEWGDDATLVERIEKLFPGQAGILLATTKKPVVDALGQLKPEELKRLGVSIVGAGDRVFVKACDSNVDKLVAKILKEGAQEEEGGEGK